MNSGKAWWSWVMLLAVVAGVVMYAGGFLSGERIAPGDVGAAESMQAPQRTATIERSQQVVVEELVGTVNSRRTVMVAAQLPARVVSVAVDAGSSVKKGDVLAKLDDREINARLAQAKQAAAAADAGIARAKQGRAQAEARATQAQAARERTAKLLADKAATNEMMEAADAAHLAAQAGLADASAAIAMAEAERERALQGVNEAEIALGYTTIAAPLDGVVAQRSVEAGDLAWPGRVLVTLLDPAALRFEASVREGLIGRVKLGDELEVAVDSVGRVVRAKVAEILPMADPRSRTFDVRADLDAADGLRPGMFGRLRLKTGTREAVLAPSAAIARVGQLHSVVVEDQGRWTRRVVTLGAELDGERVEVLSGLAGGERVGLGAERK